MTWGLETLDFAPCVESSLPSASRINRLRTWLNRRPRSSTTIAVRARAHTGMSAAELPT